MCSLQGNSLSPGKNLGWFLIAVLNSKNLPSILVTYTISVLKLIGKARLIIKTPGFTQNQRLYTHLLSPAVEGRPAVHSTA